MSKLVVKTSILALLGLILFSSSLSAQNLKGLKVNQLSDQQMTQVWQQFSGSGMSESEAVKMMVKNGLNPNEVGPLKNRLVSLQTSQKKLKTGSKLLIKDTATFLHDTSWIAEVPYIRKTSKYYGYEIFSNPGTGFEPNFNLATPANYILGPGDMLNITLTGLNETEVSAKVSKEGSINIEYVGYVFLNGLTVEQAKQRIFSKISKSYPALTTGKTHLNVSVESIRSIKVSVVGEVERAGDYHVSAVASFFNALYITGGPTENGSLRAIQLIRNNKTVASIDLYPFLQKGILQNDIRLEDQDVIVFVPNHKRVEMAGQVKRPFIYELLPNETLIQALNYAGGFSDSAFTDRLKVVQLNGREKTFKDIESNVFANYVPQQGDLIYAEKLEPVFENKVTIAGAVYRPGQYGYTPNLTLKTLLKKTDGLRPDAFLTRATIKRISATRERSMLSVNLQNLFQNASADIALHSEDTIQIYTKQELEELQYITIEGYVRNPGKILYREGMQVQDLIAMAGGFTKDAALHRVELSRIIKNKTDILTNELVDLVKLSLDSSLASSDAKYVLQAQDYIYVPRLLNSVFIGDVKVNGAVLFPGNFALEKRDETIENILTRAGGLTKYGSLKDLQVYRNGVLIGVNLDENNSKDLSLPLLPGDSLFISRNDPFVEITGAVYSPQLTRYESSSFKSYISAAGGVKNRASLAKAYIHYGNGINQKQTKFLFFRFYPRVTPGSKIIVPEMPEKEKGLSVTELSAITSIVSALVGLAAILKL